MPLSCVPPLGADPEEHLPRALYIHPSVTAFIIKSFHLGKRNLFEPSALCLADSGACETRAVKSQQAGPPLSDFLLTSGLLAFGPNSQTSS
jgi:hypothetical protein